MSNSIEVENRIRDFKLPENFDSERPYKNSMVCPKCEKKKLYDYLNPAVISGVGKTNSLVCINCWAVFPLK